MLDLYNYDSFGETNIENALSNAFEVVKPGSIVTVHVSTLKDKTETAKTCPKCGPATKLIVRTNRKDKSQFLGCSNSECDYSEELPESIKLQLLGTPRLPGF